MPPDPTGRLRPLVIVLGLTLIVPVLHAQHNASNGWPFSGPALVAGNWPGNGFGGRFAQALGWRLAWKPALRTDRGSDYHPGAQSTG